MKQSKKKSTPDLFIQFVLENGKNPVSVFEFCKANDLIETDFYKEFPSIKALEKKVLGDFFTYTSEMLSKNEAYQQYGPQEKLLSFYFTFFEVLTAIEVMYCLP